MMPKKEMIKTRTQAKRAASKEALKQMQILLDDEDDTLDAASDDEVLAVETSPPKKKYKLSHRKSSDGNDRDVIVLKTVVNHNTDSSLELGCWSEDLEPCQIEKIKTAQQEETELEEALDKLLKSSKSNVVHKNNLTTIIEVVNEVHDALTKTAQATLIPSQSQNIIVNNNNTSTSSNAPQSFQLVMDSRLRLIALPSSTPQSTPKVIQGKVQVATGLQATKPGQQQTPQSSQVQTRSLRTRPKPSRLSAPSVTATPSPSTTTSSKSKPITLTPVSSLLVPKSSRLNRKVTSSPTITAITTPNNTTIPLPNIRPSENNVEGGLSTGQKAGNVRKVVDLTSDRGIPDSKEISFNKLQGKTYPSLVVVARPYLRINEGNSDRSELDAKVKSVLMYPPTKFTEWLIQQGLVRSEQKCAIHYTTPLKLGMYSDVAKFPYSGGYVWISECCPQRFVSVFSGSLFEGSPHPPMVILKLMYHWACQTNIQNVTQWVKVDNLFVKGMYTWLRSVCTVAIHTHLTKLGGPGIKIEIGVISLGTTSQDGNQRQVKVEVLGVLETTTKLIRLRAVEPLNESDKNYKRRFAKILEPIVQWVHPSSTIITDLTVDKSMLQGMGFSNVVQNSGSANRIIMEYLRRIVPRMFQNTLSLLSRQIIQQFLDELVWREWFGVTSLEAFDNLLKHASEQSRFDCGVNLIVRLNKVALNPFKNWAISKETTATTTTPTVTTSTNSIPAVSKSADSLQSNIRRYSRARKQEPQVLDINRPPKSTSPDIPEQLVPLENYYYGTIDRTNPTPVIPINVKCPLCKNMFTNNIQLMMHLFKHAHNGLPESQLCRYCLTSTPSTLDLHKHIASSHPNETKHDHGFVCLICESQYMNPFILGKHMSKEHCPSELPYMCGTCGYRCSNHRQSIDHFYNKHNNGPTIQCPFCLKSTSVAKNTTQNVNFFIQHLQKHQRKQCARKCGKCSLWFVQKDVLRDHFTRMHLSQRGKAGLQPYQAPRSSFMVPKSKLDKFPSDGDVINFSTLFFNVPKTYLCKECNLPMDSAKHYPSLESCQNPNCQYSTCCTNAMKKHNANCIKSLINGPTAVEKLPYEMFCVCGYSSIDGNQLAKHLAICERKSAYPSLACSKAACVTHSMLDVLGLVRKPEEASTTTDKKDGDKNEPISVDEMFEYSENSVKDKAIEDDLSRDSDTEDVQIIQNDVPLVILSDSEHVSEESQESSIETSSSKKSHKESVDKNDKLSVAETV